MYIPKKSFKLGKVLLKKPIQQEIPQEIAAWRTEIEFQEGEHDLYFCFKGQPSLYISSEATIIDNYTPSLFGGVSYGSHTGESRVGEKISRTYNLDGDKLSDLFGKNSELSANCIPEWLEYYPKEYSFVVNKHHPEYINLVADVEFQNKIEQHFDWNKKEKETEEELRSFFKEHCSREDYLQKFNDVETDFSFKVEEYLVGQQDRYYFKKTTGKLPEEYGINTIEFFETSCNETVRSGYVYGGSSKIRALAERHNVQFDESYFEKNNDNDGMEP